MIYKYLPASPESLELLQRAEIKFVHSSTTCDPFDFAPVIIEGAPKAQEKERLGAALAAWGFNDPGKAEPHEEYFEEIEDYQPSFPSLISKTYYSSFCLRPDNPVVWARSARGMTGFCIGFEEEALVGDGRAERFIKVVYPDDRPVVDAFLYALALDQYNFHKSMMPEEEVVEEAWATMEAIWVAAFATKSRDWVAELKNQPYVDVNAGELHRQLGGYPGKNHQMPSCCQIMEAERRALDEIVAGPPSGKGASLTIRYRLPR